MPPTSVHYIFLITTGTLFLSHEVNTSFVRWNKTKWRKLAGTLLKLGASLKNVTVSRWWSYENYVKRCNHFGFEIACHSLLLCFISKTLMHLLLLTSQDIVFQIWRQQLPQVLGIRWSGEDLWNPQLVKWRIDLRNKANVHVHKWSENEYLFKLKKKKNFEINSLQNIVIIFLFILWF